MGAFDYILAMALAQGIILAFFLTTSRFYRSAANNWLALALLLISTTSILDVLGSSYAPRSVIVEFFLHDLELGFLVYIPLFYFFRLSATNSRTAERFNYFLLIPFVADTLINVSIVNLYPIETIADHSGIQAFYEVETLAEILFNGFLCYQSWQLIRNEMEESEKRKWVVKIWRSTLILMLAWILQTIAGYAFSSSITVIVSALYILFSLWMFWFLYDGVVNLKLIDDRKNLRSSLAEDYIRPASVREQSTDSHGSTFRNHEKDTMQRHFDTINKLLIQEGLYLNEELSLDDVASQVNLSPGYISKIIRQATGSNFPKLITELRVNHAKVMLNDKRFHQYTAVAIGLESGFKSKSAFYEAFKRITGETPAKFRK